MTATDDGTALDGAHLLCLGLGYTARALARRVSAQGATISGTARSPERAETIVAAGWRGIHFAGEEPSPELVATIGEASHVLLSAAPDATGDPILARLGSALARSARLEWIGYLSTVGVYGDHGGGWVDETTPPRDPGARGQRRLDAEAAWLAFGAQHGKRVEIFRLPGIYGPGRSVVDQLLAGRARRIAKPGQVFNRIHVDDIASALQAAMARPSEYTIYNLVDDEPAPAEEVVAYAAGLLGLPVPPLVPFEDAQLSSMATSFYAQSKRVSNRRMTSALGATLAYPTYREGITAIVRSMRG